MMRLKEFSVGGLAWFLYALAGPSAFLSIAGEPDMSPHLSRPPDIATERLDRPRPEPDRFNISQSGSRLRQAEAIALAKGAAKQELGRSFDEYDVKAVVFDPTEKVWSITFDPKQSRRSSETCLIVFVRDETKGTELRRCSSFRTGQ
jgi:hypothetical protein